MNFPLIVARELKPVGPNIKGEVIDALEGKGREVDPRVIEGLDELLGNSGTVTSRVVAG